jgi:soluble lytic murein transglycosylase
MKRPVTRFLSKLALSLGCSIVLAAGWVVWRSPDPNYAAHELVFRARFHRYDAIIREAARQRDIDPMLIKAVIWRESRFRPDMAGQDGERGLMQITDAAASEWAKSEKVTDFTPTDLFDPKTNIDAGSWLLARALRRYQGKDNPLPFALAEYNAGRSRVVRWAAENKDKDAGQPETGGADSHELQANIDIPSTKRYVETVQSRVRFYHQRGRL